MKIPVKTLRSGIALPVYGLGTYYLGGKGKNFDPHYDSAADLKAIRQALDSGVTHFDTAEIYAQGASERLLGEAIKGYPREQLFIASKAYSNNLKYRDFKQACYRSLDRLGVSYLDLYMPHAFNKEVPLEETAQALGELCSEGLVRFAGLSNFSLSRLKKFQEIFPFPIAANQVHYSLRSREPEETGLLKYCQENDIFLVAWRPVQLGDTNFGNNIEVANLLKKYSFSICQLSLSWLISQPNVLVICKTLTPKHLEENLACVLSVMDTEDVDFLRREFPEQDKISKVVPIGR